MPEFSMDQYMQEGTTKVKRLKLDITKVSILPGCPDEVVHPGIRPYRCADDPKSVLRTSLDFPIIGHWSDEWLVISELFSCVFFPRGLILELYLGGLRIKKYVWCKNELFSGLVGGMISDLQMFSCLKVFLLCCRVSYVAADTSRAIIFQRNDLINKKPGFESGRQQQLMRLPIMKISFERLGRCGSYKMISKWLEILCQRSARCFALCAWVPWGFPSTWNRFWVFIWSKKIWGDAEPCWWRK